MLPKLATLGSLKFLAKSLDCLKLPILATLCYQKPKIAKISNLQAALYMIHIGNYGF